MGEMDDVPPSLVASSHLISLKLDEKTGAAVALIILCDLNHETVCVSGLYMLPSPVTPTKTKNKKMNVDSTCCGGTQRRD
jgi:hypothetical protein